MKSFSRLFEELDSTTSTNEKIEALKKYFRKSNAEDSMWTVLLLTGRTSKRVLTGRALRDLFLLATEYPEWLFEECHAHVGDTAETISLLAQSLGICLLPDESVDDRSLTEWLEKIIPALGAIDDQQAQATAMIGVWEKLTAREIFIVNKLMTGAFRVGVSEKIVIRSLAEVHNLPSDQIAHRLTGLKKPGAESFAGLISSEVSTPSFSQPYPFCLAHAWTDRSEEGWNPKDWCIEWKYDGIRSQVISREGQIWIWSRGEEEITHSFPDIAQHFKKLPPGTVLDGEIVVIENGRILPFQSLQKRLGRKKVSAAVLKENPAGFIAYDCLEANGTDIRNKILKERKEILQKVISPFLSGQVKYSEILFVKSLEDLEELRSQARQSDAEGLMIKAWQSPYAVGRKTGNWWKHKVDPLTLDAVLLYAQAGSGRRANLYTDYTFALWSEEGQLIPFAKAYSGLDQKEIDELDNWIRRHTKEKFGPVRSVEPHYVFEIAFEGISKSTRHKSGIAVRFPRILRWRKDKKPEDADTLETAEHLLHAPEALA